MELHTLGVHGGYTQQDVMEVARCLTGWTVRDKKRFFKGKVEFDPKRARRRREVRARAEDPRRPRPGRSGPRARDRGAASRHRAVHLRPNSAGASSPTSRRPAAIAATAAAFTASGGDIRATLRALFATPEFAESRGVKLKRPFHFVVSALRATNARTDGGPPVIDALLRMGHAPFRYPTPDGYPEEASHWMGTLLWRWNFAVALAENRLKGTRDRRRGIAARCSAAKPACWPPFSAASRRRRRRAARGAGSALAVALASPAFQRC